MTREEAIKILSNYDGHGIPSGYNGGYAEAMNIAVEALKAEPVKHGRWIEDEYGIPHCSNCGAINNTVYRNYCPNCGAQMMDGGKSNV